jgi:1,4-alpha-glucan branching enzyme
MKTTTKAGRRGGRAVRAVNLEIYEPAAIDVCVAGSFNNWEPQATPLVPLGNGRWCKELTLPEGRYEYRFVVDGAWVNDPKAEETAPNPFGSVNSILTINGRA